MTTQVELMQGDCLQVMAALPDSSVDTCITDPPYGLRDHKPDEVAACVAAWLSGQPYEPNGRGFMGHSWDAWVPGPEVWREVFRILKPGGSLLVFAGTRSLDLMMLAIRLAGFEIRDNIGFAYSPASIAAWVNGQGFPKGLNISKAIDAAAGAQRPVVGQADRKTSLGSNGRFRAGKPAFTPEVTAPATPDAAEWDGWNTTLKPAWEPIVLAMKPLDGSFTDNALKWGVAGLWVDGGRLPLDQPDREEFEAKAHKNGHGLDTGSYSGGFSRQQDAIPDGRWPANVIHDGSEAVEAQFPETTGRGARPALRRQSHWGNGNGTQDGARLAYDGVGSAARFFYSAKATQGERDAGTYGLFWRNPESSAGWERIDAQTFDTLRVENQQAAAEGRRAPHRIAQGNIHPTVKPLALCRYLVRLTKTPTGGSVIDPFAGSGSIPIAAMLEGRPSTGIEADPDYLEIARRRLDHWRAEMAIEQAALPMEQVRE